MAIGNGKVNESHLDEIRCAQNAERMHHILFDLVFVFDWRFNFVC